MRKSIAIGLVSAFLCLIAAIHFWPSRHEAVFYPMGGIPFRVIAYGRSAGDFNDDVKSAEEEVARLEGVFNSHRDSSEVSLINRQTHGKALEMSADMIRVISSAQDWWARTDGAFDITVGPLIRLWKEAAEKKTVPSEFEMKRALKSVGSDKIEIEDEDCKTTIKMKTEGSELDLGGIAKGDIVDQVAATLQARGVKRGVVEAGGDILAFGPGKFRIGIQDPTAKAGAKLIGEIEMPAGAIVTSGNYERFVEIGGKKYSHIIDPKTGMPVDNGLVAVTVAGGKCIDADALATALMVLGRERAVDVLGRNPAFRAILVEQTGNEYTLWGARDVISMIHLEKPWVHHVKPL